MATQKELQEALENLRAAGIEITPEMEEAAKADHRTDEEKVADNVWMVIAFYLDDTSKWADVKRDAMDEREVRQDNVKIFAHAHTYREECNKKCEEF